jgi:hypothetical protein
MRIREITGQQPADPGAQHIRQRQRQPRETAVQLAQQLILCCRPELHPAPPVRRPGGQLSERAVRFADQYTPAGQQQFGDRLQVDRVGLHPTTAHHPALLGDVRRVQLHQLPTRPYRR